MPLTLPEVISLASACAPAVAPATLAAVARAESGLDPWAIGINGGVRLAHPPANRAQAMRMAHDLTAAGHDIDIGLAQVNVRNLPRLGLSMAEAFDPCRNLAAAGRLLVEGYRRADPAPGREQQALRVALSFYNTGHPTRGLRNGYVARVVGQARPAAGQSGPAPHRPAPVVVAVAVEPTPSRPFVITISSGAQP